MNGPRGDVLLAVLLVIAGHLGVIAGSLTSAPMLNLMGIAAFLFAVALIVGMLIGQFRAGMRERQPAQRRTAEYVGEDGGPVPTVTPRQRPRAVDYRSLD